MDQVLRSRLIQLLDRELQHSLCVFDFDSAGCDRSSGGANLLDRRSQSGTVISVFQPTGLHFSKSASGTVCIRH